MNQHAAKTDRYRTLWLVIPCYNDTARLAQFLPQLCAELASSPIRGRVQVVDDGSAPAERIALAGLIQETRARFPMVQPAIFVECNVGKGAAILRGWEAGEGADWLGFLDADGAVPAREVRRFFDLIESDPENQDCLFASRIRMRGRTVERSFKRHLSGRIFASLIGWLIDARIYDSQCGFKLIPKVAHQAIAPFLKEQGFAFDVELLALLNDSNYAIREIPVDWIDIPGSKVSLIRDSLRMLRAVCLIHSRMKTAPKRGYQPKAKG